MKSSNHLSNIGEITIKFIGNQVQQSLFNGLPWTRHYARHLKEAEPNETSLSQKHYDWSRRQNWH